MGWIVYDELSSVFGKVPGVMKALSPWPDMLELYSKVIGLIMLSETLLTRSVKEMIAELVSRVSERPIVKFFYGRFGYYLTRR